MYDIEALARLVAQFTKLPGVGQKTAQRYAYKIINMSEDEVEAFAQAIVESKQKVHYCPVCGGYTDKDVCDICSTRDKRVICVVKEPKDVAAFEKVKDFKGVYHVLHGTINPLLGVGVDDIRIKELLQRLDGVEEVIMATNPDVDGEATAVYIARLIKPMGIKVTRIASGISMGSDIEYADEVTLSRALQDRKQL
ncbi:MAG: recombination mediator RecR [Clostridia bacterium]|nr:recombination mediator RecR [Clostridia bacterium]MDY4083805.1 recombination mediator RecR [Eubacteriales bacterium]